MQRPDKCVHSSNDAVIVVIVCLFAHLLTAYVRQKRLQFELEHSCLMERKAVKGYAVGDVGQKG